MPAHATSKTIQSANDSRILDRFDSFAHAKARTLEGVFKKSRDRITAQRASLKSDDVTIHASRFKDLDELLKALKVRREPTRQPRPPSPSRTRRAGLGGELLTCPDRAPALPPQACAKETIAAEKTAATGFGTPYTARASRISAEAVERLSTLRKRSPAGRSSPSVSIGGDDSDDLEENGEE